MDFEPHHAGRSTRTGELLLFDLSDVAFAPRFWDVGEWWCFGAPDDLYHYGISRQELAEYYLEEYVRWGGHTVPIDRFLEEIKVLYFAWRLNVLGMVFNHWLSAKPVEKLELIHPLYRELNNLLNAFADSSFRRILLLLSGITE
jgi:hypothetical protein